MKIPLMATAIAAVTLTAAIDHGSMTDSSMSYHHGIQMNDAEQ